MRQVRLHANGEPPPTEASGGATRAQHTTPLLCLSPEPNSRPEGEGTDAGLLRAQVFPHLFPQACNAPCCTFGKIISLQHEEPPCYPCCPAITCGMGKRGCVGCCALAPIILFGGVPVGMPLQFSFVASALTVIQRVQIMEMCASAPDAGAGASVLAVSVCGSLSAGTS